MSFTAQQETDLLNQLQDLQDTVSKIFNMLNNTVSSREMRQLTYIRQNEISDILTRLTTVEAEVRSLSSQVASALDQ